MRGFSQEPSQVICAAVPPWPGSRPEARKASASAGALQRVDGISPLGPDQGTNSKSTVKLLPRQPTKSCTAIRRVSRTVRTGY
jgi:hypothetical protein